MMVATTRAVMNAIKGMAMAFTLIRKKVKLSYALGTRTSNMALAYTLVSTRTSSMLPGIWVRK